MRKKAQQGERNSIYMCTCVTCRHPGAADGRGDILALLVPLPRTAGFGSSGSLFSILNAV